MDILSFSTHDHSRIQPLFLLSFFLSMIGFSRLLRATALNNAVTTPHSHEQHTTALRRNAAQRLFRILVLLSRQHVSHLGNLLQLHLVLPCRSKRFLPLRELLLALFLRLREDGVGLHIKRENRNNGCLCVRGQNLVQRVREVCVVCFLNDLVVPLYEPLHRAYIPSTLLLLPDVILLHVLLLELIILNNIAQVARIERVCV